MHGVRSRLWNLFAFIAAALIAVSYATGNEDSLDDYTISCYNARNMRADLADFCWMVSWTSATLYNNANFSVYRTGDPISVTEQDLVARAFAADLVDMSSERVSIECKNAVRRFACVSVFPYCPAVSQSFSGSSYLPPCNMQCEQVNHACTTSLYAHVPHPVSIDCSIYRSNQHCLLNVPEDRFLLDPDQGPYDGIAVLYIAMLVVWVLASALWVYLLYVVYPDTALPVSKALAVVPLLRALTAVFSVIFWLDCIENGGLCQNIRAAALLLFLPFIESVQMFLFLALAKGWGTTRTYLPPDTWRVHTFLSFAFFVCLTVFSRTLTPATVNWVIYSAVLYGTMYGFILRSALREMAVLDAQVLCLTARMSPLAVEPLREKHSLFQRFLLLVLCELLLEGICRYLLAARTVPFLGLLLVYELGSALFLGLVGWSYRPRLYSPFYFMMPTSLEYSAVAGQEEEADEVRGIDDELGGNSWWTADRGRGRNRSRGPTSRTHDREREDDLADIERVRLARAQRPSPFVEVFVSRVSETALSSQIQARQPLLTSGGGGAPSSLSTSTERSQQSPQQVGSSEHMLEGGVEMTVVRRGEVPIPAPAPASVLPSLPADSIDLTRLLAAVGSPLAPHSARGTGTASEGAQQTAVGVPVVGAAGGGVGGNSSAGLHLHLRDLGLGGDWATQHQSQQHSDLALRQNQSTPMPAPVQPPQTSWGGWTMRGDTAATTQRQAAPRTRMIAVTSPDCEEVMLAISKPDV